MTIAIRNKVFTLKKRMLWPYDVLRLSERRYLEYNHLKCQFSK